MKKQLPFMKVQGLGNDYVLIDARNEQWIEYEIDLPSLTRSISDRHLGIGSDGLLLLGQAATDTHADARMRIFNADGSEAQMCGNGVRCAGSILLNEKTDSKTPVWIQLTDRIVCIKRASENQVTVDMGLPVISDDDLPRIDLATTLSIADAHAWRTGMVEIGNPHLIVLIPSGLNDLAVEIFGPILENHSAFPERINVQFVEFVESGVMQVRTWERGSGITLACGSGACAAAIWAIHNRLGGFEPDTWVTVRLPGGDLVVAWAGNIDQSVQMRGPAECVFEGLWPMDRIPWRQSSQVHGMIQTQRLRSQSTRSAK